jgi:transcriptional regulator with XRE-family HTH domain
MTALRVAISDSGFTQSDICKELGIKQPSLSKKLRCKEKVDVIFMFKVMKIVNAPINDIFPDLQEKLAKALTLTPENNQQALNQILGLLMLQANLIDYKNTESTEIQS